MSLDNFIPSVWAGNILRAFDTALVYPACMNRDYEGEITAMGDTVRINAVGDVTISTFAKNTDLAAPEALTDAQTLLKVDQGKYFNFQVDDVDKAQQKPAVMMEAARRAAYGLRKVTDSFCASLYTDISASNLIGSDGSPITGTWATAGSLAYDRLVDMGVLLDTNDVPDDGTRFAVVPPWFVGYLLKDQRFIGSGTEAQDVRLRTRRISQGGELSPGSQPNGGAGSGASPVGQAAGFWIYKSNQVPNTAATKYKIIAGHPDSWSYADQILKTEAYRPERRFGDALKGLHVYGAKVVRPYGLTLMTANPT